MNLNIVSVGKKYKSGVWGLCEFRLDFSSGVMGLLGPNGAGKTTLMNTITTITRPTAGTVSWDGIDIVRSPHEIRSVLGYWPQGFGAYPKRLHRNLQDHGELSRSHD